MNLPDTPNSYPTVSPPVASYPGKNLGITAMTLSLINLLGIPTALIGLILGYVALGQSRELGLKNDYAKVAIITGWAVLVLALLLAFFIVLLAFASSGNHGGYK